MEPVNVYDRLKNMKHKTLQCISGSVGRTICAPSLENYMQWVWRFFKEKLRSHDFLEDSCSLILTCPDSSQQRDGTSNTAILHPSSHSSNSSNSPVQLALKSPGQVSPET